MISGKNKVIIVICLVIFIVASLIFSAFSEKQEIDNSIVTKDRYYVEKGLEKVAKIVKPAIESYLDQNSTEQQGARAERLKKHFVDDSPIYDYTPLNTSPLVKKSTGKVTSVTSCGDQEGDYLCARVMASITYTYDGFTVSRSQTYWMALELADNNKYKPYNVGELTE